MAAMLVLAACASAPADTTDVPEAPTETGQAAQSADNVLEEGVSEDVEELDLEIDPSEFDY